MRSYQQQSDWFRRYHFLFVAAGIMTSVLFLQSCGSSKRMVSKEHSQQHTSTWKERVVEATPARNLNVPLPSDLLRKISELPKGLGYNTTDEHGLNIDVKSDGNGGLDIQVKAEGQPRESVTSEGSTDRIRDGTEEKQTKRENKTLYIVLGAFLLIGVWALFKYFLNKIKI